MSEQQELHTARVVGSKLTIEIDIPTMKFAFENHPYLPGDGKITIKDEKRFAEDVADRILDFDEDETGISAIFRIFDEIFEDIYTNGPDYLEEHPEDENEG